MTSFGALFRIAVVTGSNEAAFGFDGLFPFAISVLTAAKFGEPFQKSAFIRELLFWAFP
ncbi:hypothetical protein D3C87_2053860 [compost metagenome]